MRTEPDIDKAIAFYERGPHGQFDLAVPDWLRELKELRAALRKLYRAQCRDGTLGTPGYVHVAAKDWDEVGRAFQEVINEPT